MALAREQSRYPLSCYFVIVVHLVLLITHDDDFDDNGNRPSAFFVYVHPLTLYLSRSYV